MLARPVVFVLAVWAASRAFFLAVGAAAHEWIRAADFVGAYRRPPGALGYWANWDGGWFLHIAQHGYDSVASTAFFPLFPLVVRLVHDLGVGYTAAALAVSNVAAFFALYFVFGLARERFDAEVARAATLAFAFFPTSLYLVAAYSESLFLALAAGSLWALYVRRHLAIAGLFAYFAAMTRNVGVVLVLPIAWEFLRRGRATVFDGLVGVAGPLAGLGCYLIYLWRGTSKPLLFASAYRTNWGRKPADPFTTAASAWGKADNGLPYLGHPARVFGTSSGNPPFAVMDTLNFAFWVVLVLLALFAVARLRGGLALYTLPVALVSISSPAPGNALVSLPRYVLTAFPIFIALGSVLARRRAALVAWLAASASAGAYLTCMFVTGRWVS